MKKLFVSQPMNGKSDKEILDERNRLIAEAEERSGEKFEVLETFFRGAPADAKPLWYLGESLKLLSTADVAYFANGWKNARGCKIEHICAEQYGINIVEA